MQADHIPNDVNGSTLARQRLQSTALAEGFRLQLSVCPDLAKLALGSTRSRLILYLESDGIDDVGFVLL